MGRREYGYEVREQAENLFVYDGKTFEEVAEATGVSLSQLKEWAQGTELPDGERVPSWTEKRRRSQHLQGIIKYKKQEAYLKALEQIINEPSNQNFQSLLLIEKVITGKGEAVDKGALVLDFLREQIAYLRDHDGQAIDVLNRNFDGLAAHLKARFAA